MVAVSPPFNPTQAGGIGVIRPRNRSYPCGWDRAQSLAGTIESVIDGVESIREDFVQHYVFLVHGMGVHAAGWSDKLQGQIKKGYTALGAGAAADFDTAYKFIEIEYDSVFQRILKQWQQNAGLIASLDADVQTSVHKWTDWLTGAANTQGNFVWSHAVDVLFYRGSALLRADVRATVLSQILTPLRDALAREGSIPEWSVVAHSLGTSVAHDSLAALYDTSVGGDPPVSPTDFRANLMMMVANVSRVLETHPYDVFASVVRPATNAAAQAACWSYLNVRHVLDPFVYPKPFNPIDWPDAATVKAGAYKHLQPSHLHIETLKGVANIHDIEHYFAHPAVMIEFFRRSLGKSAVTAAAEKQALFAFNNLPFGSTIAMQVKKRLEDLIGAAADDWPVFREIWDGLRK